RPSPTVTAATAPEESVKSLVARIPVFVLLFAAVLSVLSVHTATGQQGQTRTITGRVVDSLTSDAITSGQVSIAGTTTVTTIRDDGTFSIAAPQRSVVVTIRSIGFKRRDLQVPTTQSSVRVTLARDFFQLEAVVVTGQATGIERKNLPTAIATVEADALVKTPAASVEQQLAGKLSD